LKELGLTIATSEKQERQQHEEYKSIMDERVCGCGREGGREGGRERGGGGVFAVP